MIEKTRTTEGTEDISKAERREIEKTRTLQRRQARYIKAITRTI